MEYFLTPNLFIGRKTPEKFIGCFYKTPNLFIGPSFYGLVICTASALPVTAAETELGIVAV